MFVVDGDERSSPLGIGTFGDSPIGAPCCHGRHLAVPPYWLQLPDVGSPISMVMHMAATAR
ncbi:hypothetical protein E2562_004859 [Oryza meyeriana var. granulata]|uniref:Uncharacterized protein n=1 Tax=Oryza meyeriana var. granulata TaxID=110450 RepID=A0A6G1C4F6_9ORYZ|nr:hypothetical protein E2562_004859 [Oryza meyeriana var. granulata]